MKIAQQFRAFLETHHYLSLPLIGKLEILSHEHEEENGKTVKKELRFTVDPCGTADKFLTEFISKKLKIEISVAESDLTCFCNSLNELLIHGFEAEIPGIGYLHFESNSKLKFSEISMYNVVPAKRKKNIPTIATSSFWF